MSPRPAMPFAVKLVVVFLLMDALERSIGAVGDWLHSPGWIPLIVAGLWIVTDGLLILLIGLQTFAGRLWTQVIFAIHMFYLGYSIIHDEPLLWFTMSAWGQTRLLLTMAIDGLLIHLVSRSDSKAYLCD